MNLEKKVSNLEKKVLKIDLENTRFDISSFSPKEIELMKINNLNLTRLRNESLTDEDLDEIEKVSKKVGELLGKRICFLFQNYLVEMFREITDFEYSQSRVASRLGWFMDQIIREACVEKIDFDLAMASLKDPCYEKVLINFRKKLKKRTKIWSEESYDEFLLNLFGPEWFE